MSGHCCSFENIDGYFMEVKRDSRKKTQVNQGEDSDHEYSGYMMKVE